MVYSVDSGILYNSIKSGLAVDYPIITDASKVIRTQFGDSAGAKRDNWALVANTASFQSNEDFWDKRLDFENQFLELFLEALLCEKIHEILHLNHVKHDQFC